MTRSRQRKKAKQRALKQEQQKTPEDDESSRGKAVSEPVLLNDPRKTYDDIRLIGRAVKHRWEVPEDDCRFLVKRLREVIDKRKVTVHTKDGPVSDEVQADINAIAAGRVLTVIVGQNQADDHMELKAAQPGTQVNVNVGVQVNHAVQSAVGTEPEYLDWVRQQQLADSGNPDVVGSNGFAAKVPDSAPRLGTGPGSNGHH